MKKTKVLCFLDNPVGRDTEIVLPVIYVMEKHLNAEVKTKFIWDLYYIKLWKPDAVLLPNTVGHHMYVEAAEFCHSHNIIVLALESEGNFRTDGSFNYWGYNTKKTIYQDWLTCWSQRTKKYLTQVLDQEIQSKIVLTGATGFDHFSFSRFKGRDSFFKQHQLPSYKKVIGYAGWAFGKLYGAHLDTSFLGISKIKGREKALKWVEEQRLHVREVLRKVIENNPDTLFILKKHPKENFESDPKEGPNEMNELLHLSNTIYLKSEETTSDLISISDLWLGFETTSALEAWLLHTPTILLNNDTDFPRSDLHQGSMKASDAKDLQNTIDEFFSSGRIAAFETNSLQQKRASLITDAIGFSDGKNHLRACYYFKQSLEKSIPVKSVKLSWRHLRLYLLMHLGRFFYHHKLFSMLPKFKKTIYVFENRSMPGFDQRKKECFENLNDFYKKEGLDEQLRTNNWDIFVS